MEKNLEIEQNIKEHLITSFQQVKDIVKIYEGRSRAGLMLGLQELGASLDGFIGAYYPVASNIIVVNKTPLKRIMATKPQLLNPYSVHILLHEYLHSLGYLDEQTTRQKTFEISKQHFGTHHLITQFSTNIRQFFPHLVYPVQGWIPKKNVPPIELVPGFDHSSFSSYIT